jgi:hypothetical protein
MAGTGNTEQPVRVIVKQFPLNLSVGGEGVRIVKSGLFKKF